MVKEGANYRLSTAKSA